MWGLFLRFCSRFNWCRKYVRLTDPGPNEANESEKSSSSYYHHYQRRIFTGESYIPELRPELAKYVRLVISKNNNEYRVQRIYKISHKHSME